MRAAAADCDAIQAQNLCDRTVDGPGGLADTDLRDRIDPCHKSPFYGTICAITQMESAGSTLQQIGQRVRDERRRQGMDQRTLAMVANVAVRSVHRVEHSEPTVRLDVLMRILAALGLRLDVHGRGET